MKYSERSIETKLKDNLRRRLAKTLKGNPRHKKAWELLGCEIVFFKKYLEEQFDNKMNWDNYGEWHIDHIKPCMTFNMKRKGDQIKCFHYKNMRPLWGDENRKRKKLI